MGDDGFAASRVRLVAVSAGFAASWVQPVARSAGVAAGRWCPVAWLLVVGSSAARSPFVGDDGFAASRLRVTAAVSSAGSSRAIVGVSVVGSPGT
ncbi:hypothetical protein [Yinghuangia seranimata]|uniref:hypothetical protein n=1 Tax=Yinghuangia seranimata TaxID=408067 RepID=UPI00248C2FB8|nr:hypothetical protein [Yinghuangia seranimata]MDI2132879.1 hypothetical protein [Yinghuangia seranimata]